jgi:poly [ADP-ribose] polymerase 10/14/15
MSTGAVLAIIIGVIAFCCCVLGGYAGYKKKQLLFLSDKVVSLEKEVKDLSESAVNMRCVKENYNPKFDPNQPNQPTVVKAAPKQPKQRAMWYWKEDAGRMAQHSPSLTMDPCWVQYAGSVAIELEEGYNAYQSKEGPEELATDLADRISSTGSEQKAHGAASGTKFRINFRDMKQLNASSGYKRDILRHLVDVQDSVAPRGGGDLEQGIGRMSTDAGMKTAMEIPVPEELTARNENGERETLLILAVGSIVQISKQRPDGWAFGNVLLNEAGDDHFVDTDAVSYDAGWFPLSCVDMPKKEDLERLAKMMGPAGGDCLSPPKEWTDMKDPSRAEQVLLKDGPEKQTAADWFQRSLNNKYQVVKVERIQNLALWQSFAVKRQTVISREGSGATASGASSGFERIWLFHGTNSETVPKIVQQGFNRSFCGKNATMYGKGVYFARDSSYSAKATYSQPDSSGVQRMFLCRVVVGEYSRGVKDALSPVPRPDDKTGTLLYDSTVDNVADPSIFVTYHDAQAYPDYLIYFKQK